MVGRVSQRIADITGLDMDTAEDLQVNSLSFSWNQSEMRCFNTSDKFDILISN